VQPARVPELVALEHELWWMLMRDGGTRLRELVESVADLRLWEELLPLYADLQIVLAPDAERLLELGVPDERLAGLPGRFERLLDDRSFLLIDEPDGSVLGLSPVLWPGTGSSRPGTPFGGAKMPSRFRTA
jgi:hypothetical protein